MTRLNEPKLRYGVNIGSNVLIRSDCRAYSRTCLLGSGFVVPQGRMQGPSTLSWEFHRITGTNSWRVVKMLRRGVTRWTPSFINKPHPKYDEMYTAISQKVTLLANSSPFAKKGSGDVIEVPFHERIFGSA